MLVTLRIYLSDGSERLLAAEVDAAPETPEELLKHFDRSGEVALGDRESVSMNEVVKVEFAPPEPQLAPPLGSGLRDEDVASAMEGRFDKPPYEEPS